MQKNTATRTITTTNFVTYRDGVEISSCVWDREFEAMADSVIASYIDAHLMYDLDAYGYRVPVEVWEYELPGQRIVVLVESGTVLTVIDVTDVAAARLHRAARREQPVTITYTKADGTETVRTVEPTGLSLTKAGDVIVKAMDRDSGEARSFRLDRISFYTVHRTRRTVRTEAPAPSKADLVAAFRSQRPVVRSTRKGFTGRIVKGSRAFGPSGWSVVVEFTPDHAHLTPTGSTRVNEDDLVLV